MGLTKNSVGLNAVASKLEIKKQAIDDKIIAIAGNPNVGKSTLFNSLTGMNQHTGNWPGKTVMNAQGYCSSDENSFVLIDIPGTYSLMAHSKEEEVARNFICFGNADAIVIVCDATCLERNLNLVLQTIEITSKVVVCVNLMDEAKRKNISIDLALLERNLGVPVVGTTARKKRSLKHLLYEIDLALKNEYQPIRVQYNQTIEAAIQLIEPVIREKIRNKISARWLSLRLLDYDESIKEELFTYFGEDLLQDEKISNTLLEAKTLLNENDIDESEMERQIVSSIIHQAEEISSKCVSYKTLNYNNFDRQLDKLLTSKLTGYPVMLLLLALVFWITITGANYPSSMLAKLFFFLEEKLTLVFTYFKAPDWLHGVVVLGGFRVLGWVVSVMLPPMAIFFPLFTLLEDAGYLPRVAYNLDKPFRCCQACGKQALTMCMGFGCNAAGIIGCRIIDSPRERLIAMLTNNFVPCNGRFPTLIAILTMFFIGTSKSLNSLYSALLLTLVIVLGVGMTFLTSKLLSITLLKGIPSSFTLELPSYRKPQVGKVLVRSLFDRTLFVLARAVIVAIPTGILIWAMANITIGDMTILNKGALLLDPFARLLGLDGVILLAFILGMPANEIVIPIIIMTYMSKGSLIELDSLDQLKSLLLENGWTYVTAISTMLFSLMHWPCSTTLMTIKKESGSMKWSVLACLIPTVMGIIVCFLFTTIANRI